jgi:nitroreductase
MQALEILRSLRAVRDYANREIPPEVILEILEVARWTGSGKNSQPWEVVVIADRRMLQQLAGLGHYASHLVGARLGIALVMDGPGREFDAGRLAHNIMLAAWAQGVGSCIASIFPADNERRARELLGVPDERSLHTVIALGYPANVEALRLSSAPENVRTAVREGRKPLSMFASWERYGIRERD